MERHGGRPKRVCARTYHAVLDYLLQTFQLENVSRTLGELWLAIN